MVYFQADYGVPIGMELKDAGQALVEALRQFFAAMPTWMMVSVVAVIAIAVGVLVGYALSRRGRAPASPRPTESAAPAAPVRKALPPPENPAVVAYREFLEGRDVSANELDTKVREFASALKDMRQNLRDLMPGDPARDVDAEAAREALEAGKFEDAMLMLTSLGNDEGRDGVHARDAAAKHLMAAALAKSVAGDLMMAQLDPKAASRQFADAVELLPDAHEELLAEIFNKHGTAAYQAGDPLAAIGSFEQSLDLLQRRLGKNHPDVAAALNNLALLYYSRGDYGRAEPLYQRSLKIDEQTLGDDHPGVATDLNNLALLYKKQGNLEAAEPLLKRALDIKEMHFDPGHPSLVTGLRNYASVLKGLGREEEAEVFEKRATTLPPARRPAAE
jgi:tetratricopeptide (TPR) repeat protein